MRTHSRKRLAATVSLHDCAGREDLSAEVCGGLERKERKSAVRRARAQNIEWAPILQANDGSNCPPTNLDLVQGDHQQLVMWASVVVSPNGVSNQ